MTDALHICLSGNPACSGINPCDACHQVYTSTILPKAMVAGGFNGSRAQAAAFFQAYAMARHEVLQHLASQIQPTLNGADPEAPTEAPPATEEWHEGVGQLSDEEVAQMAAPPPTDFAPEPDEDPGMPDEDRAKEVAAALLQGQPIPPREFVNEPLTRKDSPPAPVAEGATPKDAPRRSSRGKKTGVSTASKE